MPLLSRVTMQKGCIRRARAKLRHCSFAKSKPQPPSPLVERVSPLAQCTLTVHSCHHWRLGKKEHNPEGAVVCLTYTYSVALSGAEVHLLCKSPVGVLSTFASLSPWHEISEAMTFLFKCLYQKSRTELHLVIGLFLLNASVWVVVNQVASKNYSLIVVIYCHGLCFAEFSTVYLGSLSEAFLDALWKHTSLDFKKSVQRK